MPHVWNYLNESKGISETGILLKAMKDLLNKLDEEEKKVEALKKKELSLSRFWPPSFL